MEIRELIKAVKKEKNAIFGLMVLGLFVGLIGYFLPAKYITTGSFLVGRRIDSSSKFFTYEGYYAQQTATGFANSVVSILESVDLHSKTLEKLNSEVNEKTLRKFKRNLNITKPGPQVITVNIKGQNPEESLSRFRALSDSLTETVRQVSRDTDPNLNIEVLSEQVITRQSYRSAVVYSLAGVGFGLAIGFFYASSKIYLKSK